MNDGDPRDGAPERERDRQLDAATVERIRGGDHSAFTDLYERWFDRVHDLAWSVTRDRELAAEVTQDAFLTAWRRLDGLEQPASFGGWLLRVTRNGALQRLRKEKRSSPVDDAGFAAAEREGSPVSAPSGFRAGDALARADRPEDVAADGELVDLVWESAAALGERDATVSVAQPPPRHGARRDRRGRGDQPQRRQPAPPPRPWTARGRGGGAGPVARRPARLRRSARRARAGGGGRLRRRRGEGHRAARRDVRAVRGEASDTSGAGRAVRVSTDRRGASRAQDPGRRRPHRRRRPPPVHRGRQPARRRCGRRVVQTAVG
ncbi:MAG: sigma-70 family RNA polymerase sigma factor [Acidimicrobiia bacterium]|nr:sigma-70 family RNA polymerase sigma factor [Acidimicrobiia bacterium]